MMIMTYRIMPEDGDVDYDKLVEVAISTLKKFDESVKVNTTNQKEMGFGLKAALINFSVDEKFGSEVIEEKLKTTEEIGDVYIESMSRAMG